jgi:MarR-like DNA-binding transcriptional regulator SgrR of sgrS sRNA
MYTYYTYTALDGQTFSGTSPVTLAAQGQMQQAITWLRQDPELDSNMLASVLAALPRNRRRRLAKLIRRELRNLKEKR